MQRMSSICVSQLTFNVLFWFYFIAHFVYLYLCTFRVRRTENRQRIVIWEHFQLVEAGNANRCLIIFQLCMKFVFN